MRSTHADRWLLMSVLFLFSPASVFAHLHPTLGRFVQRDPLEYVNLPNLYAYVRSGPLQTRDPSGRVFGCTGSTPRPTCATPGYCWGVCLQNQSLFHPGEAGIVICTDDPQCKCACVNESLFPPSADPVKEAERESVRQHEECHVGQPEMTCACNPKPCVAAGPGNAANRLECECYRKQLDYLKSVYAGHRDDPAWDPLLVYMAGIVIRENQPPPVGHNCGFPLPE